MYTFPVPAPPGVFLPTVFFPGKSAAGTLDLTTGNSGRASIRMSRSGAAAKVAAAKASVNGEALVVLGSLATHLQHTHNARVIYRTHSLVIHGVPTV